MKARLSLRSDLLNGETNAPQGSLDSLLWGKSGVNVKLKACQRVRIAAGKTAQKGGGLLSCGLRQCLSSPQHRLSVLVG